jgi:hypothetical protein
VYRALLGAAAVVAGVTFFLPSPLPAGGIVAWQYVSIKKVYGVVEGTCSTARARELERSISDLTRRDLSWRNHCSCIPLVAADIKRMFKTSDAPGRQSVQRPREHAVHILLSHPVELPHEGNVPALDQGTTDIIARDQLISGFRVRTDLWLGRVEQRRHAVVYQPFILPGDPFHLAQSECKPAGG